MLDLFIFGCIFQNFLVYSWWEEVLGKKEREKQSMVDWVVGLQIHGGGGAV